ncbi:MAG: hypothetical protein KC944_01120 [Candidatus Omnitrophica bacterium]|nr:hypothetical protein [Candidatus Omnitrophota bacterium]
MDRNPSRERKAIHRVMDLSCGFSVPYFTWLVTVGLSILNPQPALSNTQVYSNTFETNGETIAPGVSVSLNTQTTTTSPGSGIHPPDTFLGELSNDGVSLALSNLPEHDRVTVRFDLFLIRSWDGNFDLDERGPDVFQVGYDGGNVLLYTTFRNAQRPMLYPEYGQSYPNTYNPSDLIQNNPRTGAVENDTLGYFNSIENIYQDSVYRLVFTFQHSGNLNFQLFASGLQDISNESWGVDDISVSVRETTNSITATRTPFMVPTFTPTKTPTERPPTFTFTPTNTPTPTEEESPPPIAEFLFSLSPIWMQIEETSATSEELISMLRSLRGNR